MKTILVPVLALFLSTFVHADPKGVSTNISNFDGTKEVNLKPYGTSSCMSFGSTCISIGALWKNNNPNQIALDLFSLNKFVNMTSLQLNIDGEIIKAERVAFAGEHKLTGNYKESLQRFVISREDFNKILQAKSVWIKIETMNPTYIETNLIDNGKETIGFQGLKRFSTQLN